MQITDTVGSIVSNDIRTAHVFKKYNIDFCCGGTTTVAKACEKKGLNPKALLHELRDETTEPKKDQIDFLQWKASTLIDYIEERHHSYVRENLPLLRAYADKVALSHGAAHRYLIDMQRLVLALIEEMIPHLVQEENGLFGYIRRLEKTPTQKAHRKAVKKQLEKMMEEHEKAGDLLKMLGILSGQFNPPEYACNSWKAYYQKLAEFQEDLYTHIHLENNILFPKAFELVGSETPNDY